MSEHLKTIIRERIKRQKYGTNEAKLRAFIERVEKGITPTDSMLQFMADGAREFLSGGKPWQKGKGGRPPEGGGPEDIKLYLVFYGRITMDQAAVALGRWPLDGRDPSKKLRRAIAHGELAFCMAKIVQVDLLATLFTELLDMDFEDLTEDQRRCCREGLRAGLADLVSDSV